MKLEDIIYSLEEHYISHGIDFKYALDVAYVHMKIYRDLDDDYTCKIFDRCTINAIKAHIDHKVRKHVELGYLPFDLADKVVRIITDSINIKTAAGTVFLNDK